jgi:glycerol-3-phosphate dehydrogenase subunit B
MRIVVVGAGLSGLFAAILSADLGARVTLVAEGRGSLALSHGGIEIWGKASPSRALPKLQANHPYAKIGLPALRAALGEFQALVEDWGGLRYAGNLSRNLSLLTAAGELRRMGLAPPAASNFDQLKLKPFTIGAVQGLLDYFPALIEQKASSLGLKVQGVIDLPVLDAPAKRALSAVDLARMFDQKPWRTELLRTWKPPLSGVSRLLLPAFLGFKDFNAIREEFLEELGCTVFEVALPSSSVPGLRLERVLRSRALDLGVEVIDGVQAKGRIDGPSRGKRVAGLALSSAGGQRQLNADIIILASGGFLHGGLEALQEHAVREPIFQLPLDFPQDRTLWTSASPFNLQPYAEIGVRVDKQLRPLDQRGRVMFENLHAIGGILAGSDRTHEGTRQGIDLSSAYKAVHAAIKPLRQTASSRRLK